MVSWLPLPGQRLAAALAARALYSQHVANSDSGTGGNGEPGGRDRHAEAGRMQGPGAPPQAIYPGSFLAVLTRAVDKAGGKHDDD